MSKDDNLMFRIYKDGTEGKLWMKGEGTFTGKIIAEEGGSLAGWNISEGALHTEDNALYLGTSPIAAKIGK
jgi:hypothetical protein